MNKWTKRALATLVVALPLSSGVAFAGTTTSSTGSGFDAAYQQKATTEASLLQQAQASTVSSPDITALGTTVTTINAQVVVLYQAEQALVAARDGIPSLSTADQKKLHDLTTKRLTLLEQSNRLWGTVQQYEHHQHNEHDKQLLKRAISDHNRLGQELKNVNNQIQNIEDKIGEWPSHPYAGGLAALQSSILKLEDAAIHYTNEWIALENQGSTTTGAVYGSSDGTSNTTVMPDVASAGTVALNGSN